MIKINITGTPIQTSLIKSILKEDKEITFVNYNDADVYYVVFGPGLTKKNIFRWLFSNKKFLIHWIGLDTKFYLVNNNGNIKSRIYTFIKKGVLMYKYKTGKLYYISSSPWLANEIEKASGIKTDYLVITSIFPEKMTKYIDDSGNRDIDFLTYSPLSSKNMYSINEIIDAAEKFPSYKFVIIVPDLENEGKYPYEIPSNVSVLKKQTQEQMWKLYSNCKCFLRMKQTGDAISLSVLEALFFKCHVLWTYEFDCCLYTPLSNLQTNLQKVIKEDKMNEKGHELIINKYSTKQWKKDFKALLRTILE